MENKEKTAVSEKTAAWYSTLLMFAALVLAMVGFAHERWKLLADTVPIAWLSDIFYDSLKLYFFAYEDPAQFWLIHVTRLLCPLTLWTFAISVISDSFAHWKMRMRSWHRNIKIGPYTLMRDSVAIYGNNKLVAQTAAGTHFIQAGEYFLKHAKRHIILMDNDEDSLSFYKAHEAEFSKDTTYIGLQQISSSLMKSIPKVFYFNVYEEIARNYWRNNNIRDSLFNNPQYNIVILGYCRDNLGYQLLKYGLMNNIFRKDQKILYHIFCKPEEAERGFELLDLNSGQRMLDDCIVWHTEQWQRNLGVIQNADRILLCRTVNPHIINQLLLTCTTQEIHYYDPDIASYPEKYAYEPEKMKAFGCTKQVLNENSILKSELHSNAMERNLQYERKYGENSIKQAIQKAEETDTLEEYRAGLWEKLDGFTKNSNIATSDYYSINPIQPPLTDQEVECRAELEHIRWCRFHFLSGWQYGEPKDAKKRKDAELRIHRALIPWDQLPEKDQEKDRQQVRMEVSQ